MFATRPEFVRGKLTLDPNQKTHFCSNNISGKSGVSSPWGENLPLLGRLHDAPGTRWLNGGDLFMFVQESYRNSFVHLRDSKNPRC